ncbi:MAG: hypothetical protein ABSG58_07840, partial [Acidimicrobiales bacterium]
MSSQALRVARYWLRANFARRWSSYLAITLIIGLFGGVAVGSLTAARRTASSFQVFLQHTNPSDMSLLLYARNETAV